MIPNVLHPLKSAIRFSSSASVALTLVRDLWHGRRLEIVNLDKSGYSFAGIGHTTSREHECHAVRWCLCPHPWGEYLFSVVAARADGARRLRRFRVASRFGIGIAEKPGARQLPTVKRPEG